jgi:hypothetical protein
VQRPRRVEQLAQRRWVRPRLWAERGDRLLGVELPRPQHLHPGGLLGPELAHAQLAPAGQPQQKPRRPVAHRRALGVQLEPPRRHQVQQHDELVVELEHEQLAAPAHARQLATLERVQRRVERLQRVDAGGERGLDGLARQDGVEPARDDLHLGQLWHAP